jgi:hypothetical protein
VKLLGRAGRLLAPGAAAVVVLLAVVGYFMFVPLHRLERGRLSQVAAIAAPSGFTPKPTNTSEQQASGIPFKELQAAAKKSPSSTGAWSVEWTGAKSAGDIASLLAMMLPSRADAATVRSQAASYYVSPDSLSSDDYKYLTSFTVPSLTGAQAALFKPATGTQLLAVSVFQDGRYVAVTYGDTGSAAQAEATASSLARSEAAHLKTLGQGLSLRVTRWPLVASLVWWAVAVALAAALVVGPGLVGRARRRRRLAREAAARRSLAVRGSKIVKRQRARLR